MSKTPRRDTGWGQVHHPKIILTKERIQLPVPGAKVLRTMKLNMTQAGLFYFYAYDDHITEGWGTTVCQYKDFGHF